MKTRFYITASSYVIFRNTPAFIVSNYRVSEFLDGGDAEERGGGRGAGKRGGKLFVLSLAVCGKRASFDSEREELSLASRLSASFLVVARFF